MIGRIFYLKPRFLAYSRSFRIFPFVLVHSHLTSFNPSIAIADDTIHFSMRHGNMLMTGNKRYGFTIAMAAGHRDMIDETSFGTIRIPEQNGPLECTLFEQRVPHFQDIRIFFHGGRWFGLGALPEQERTDAVPVVKKVVIHLMSFDPRFRVAGTVPLPSPMDAPWEKNWMPFVKERELQIVYKPSPLEVLAFDFERKQTVPVFKAREEASNWATSPHAASDWSGSSQVVAYEAGIWLGVIHRKFVIGEELAYEHAFIRINGAFEAEISRPFHFLTFGMEFCGGLVVRRNDIVLAFGSHNDSRSYVATLDREDVAELFKPAG
jgi:hypothetical protein